MRRLIPAVLFLAGCYRYTATPHTAVAAGTHVRVVLSPSPDSTLRAILGIATTAVEGRVVSVADEAWSLSVDGTYKRRSTSPQDRTNWAGERVTIPLSSVARVEERFLDRRRTRRAIVLGTVGAIVIVRLAVLAVEASSGGDDGGRGTQLRKT